MKNIDVSPIMNTCIDYIYMQHIGIIYNLMMILTKEEQKYVMQ